MDRIEDTIKRVVIATLKEYFPKQTKWLDKVEAKKLLGIKSDTTLQDLRDTNVLRYTRHGKIILYDHESIQAYLEKYSNFDKPTS